MPMRLKAVAAVAALVGSALATAAAAPLQVGFSTEPLVPERAQPVSSHIWAIKAFPNIFIVVGNQATLVVDTGTGARNGAVVAREARRLSTNGQKLYLTTTHFHPEHASGDAGFPLDTVVIRPKVQQAELETDGVRLLDFFRALSPEFKELLVDARPGKAQVVFDRNYVLRLGGVTARLMWYGPAHTRGDELIFIEEDRALISGDVVQNKIAPGMTCDECSPRTWLAVLDQITPLRPQRILADHGEFGGPELIAQERAYLANLQARALALKSEGRSAADAGQIVSAEFAIRYAGWASLQASAAGVVKVYADSR